LPDDSTTFGPDTLINKVIGAGSPPNITPFLGTGTVNFSTNLTGGASALLGGVNYVTGIKSNSWGAFRLTYYWCPTIVLAENIINFTAAKNGSMVQLQWLTENEQSGFTYEIEYSRNASSYTPVGYLQSAGEDPDVNSKYQYFYAINSSDPEKIYFRVKRTGPDGKSTYTTIKSVTLNGSVSAGMQVYPNPVKGSVTFEFDQVQNGNFSIQLVNTAGQVIQQNAVTVTGSTQIRLNLTCNPARGLYFLYTKDLTHNQQYITKVLVN
jgi:hypothetical protein